MTRRVKYFLLFLVSGFITLGLIVGCGTSSSTTVTTTTAQTSTTQAPASPPTGTNSIEVGSGGSPSAEVGTSNGTIYTVVIDGASLDPIIDLTSGNTQIFITISGESTSYECIVSAVTNNSGSSASPVSVALTLDRSGSMSNYSIASMESAAKQFVANLGTNDEAAIINFAYYIVADQALTTDKALLSWAITNESYTNSGGTNLYGSIITAINTAEGGSNLRKAVLAMTDGYHNTGSSTSTEAINQAKSKNIPVYTIGLGTSLNSSILRAIANETGGLYYSAPTASELANLYSQISSALSSSYTITFSLPSGLTFISGQTYTINFNIINYGSLTGSATFTLTMP